jgi:methylated-DNA-[protein]-cysteine S-methyltransferase
MQKAFRERVLDVVRGIPAGAVMTYAQVAAAAGSPKAYRAVGSVMKANHDPSVPCHRVVLGDGTPGEYNRGASEKRRRLAAEGALLAGTDRVRRPV